ncbi:MAG: hypothetical protein H7Y36_07935 [Armatimonadetes bacterium]|nr:hypothetical protein [Akkermansiaceae bacterium]
MLGLIHLNRHLIDQAHGFITVLSPIIYSGKCESVFSSSIGQHLRHCIEHYDELFLAHENSRHVNYEARPRDLILETDTGIALARLAKIIVSLDSLTPTPQPIAVLDTGCENPAASSLDRELQYLVSHTVHHFAIIAIIARHFDVQVPGNFGVAPSTLKHRASA